MLFQKHPCVSAHSVLGEHHALVAPFTGKERGGWCPLPRRAQEPRVSWARRTDLHSGAWAAPPMCPSTMIQPGRVEGGRSLLAAALCPQGKSPGGKSKGPPTPSHSGMGFLHGPRAFMQRHGLVITPWDWCALLWGSRCSHS